MLFSDLKYLVHAYKHWNHVADMCFFKVLASPSLSIMCGDTARIVKPLQQCRTTSNRNDIGRDTTELSSGQQLRGD